MTDHGLPDLLPVLALLHGDRPALVSAERQVSYAQLPVRAAAHGAALRELGVHPGDRVGIALGDGFDVIEALFAVWAIGAVAVPLPFRAGLAERAQTAGEFDLAVTVEDRPMPGATHAALRWQADVVALAETRRGRGEGSCRVPQTALISLTSGTTGAPLGVLVSHAALISRAMAYSFEGAYPVGARFLNVYPLSFSASRNHTLGHLLRGGTVIFRPTLFDASELIDWTLSDGATFLFAVGATVRGMLDVLPDAGRPAFPDLAMLYSGGSGMATDDKIAAARRLNPQFLHCFSTTLSGTCSVLSGADLLARPETDGRLVPQARVEIVDDAGVVLPFGATGTVRVRGPGMAHGFYGGRDRPDGDRIRDGWAYTGDLGQLSADGFLTIVGRTSDMILRGGANVYPAEVEAVLAAVAGVREVAVVGVPHPLLGEEIAAFVVTDGTVDEGSLRAACLRGLGPDKRPRHLRLCGSLPRNANGKVLKRALRDGFETTPSNS